MGYGWLIEAQYEDGFILRETPEDINPYGGGNTYTAVLNHQPSTVGGHGRLTLWAIFPEGGGEGRMIDWTTMPDNAEPVVFHKMYAAMTNSGGTEIGALGHFFGYRIPQDEGDPIEEIQQVG